MSHFRRSAALWIKMYLLIELWTHWICLVELEGTLVKLQWHVAWWGKKIPPLTSSKIRKAKPSYANLGFFTPVQGSQWTKLRNRIINCWLQRVSSVSHGVRESQYFSQFRTVIARDWVLSHFQTLDVSWVLVMLLPAPIPHPPFPVCSVSRDVFCSVVLQTFF